MYVSYVSTADSSRIFPVGFESSMFYAMQTKERPHLLFRPKCGNIPLKLQYTQAIATQKIEDPGLINPIINLQIGDEIMKHGSVVYFLWATLWRSCCANLYRVEWYFELVEPVMIAACRASRSMTLWPVLCFQSTSVVSTYASF